MRTFNDGINSKTGSPLPLGAPRRGTPEWLQFQDILIKSLKELKHSLDIQLENPLAPDVLSDRSIAGDWKRIYVHQTKRTKPEGDLFWIQMHLRNIFTIDTQGWGAEHSEVFQRELMPSTEEEDADFCKALSERLSTSGTSKIDQPPHTDETPWPYIFVPTQTPRDYTIAHHSPITVKYFIESLVNWADEHERHLCFKLHPCGRDAELLNAVQQSSYVHLVEGNIHELIKRSIGLFVINSGTGFEALIHGKPVATFGSCDYNRVTFNADIRRIDEACYFLDNYREEYRRLAHKFVHWYCKKHAYDVYDPSTPTRLTEYLRSVL